MRKLRVRFSVWTVAGSADRTTIVVPFCMLRFSSAQPSHKTLSGRHHIAVLSGQVRLQRAVQFCHAARRVAPALEFQFGSVLSSMGNDNVVRRICV